MTAIDRGELELLALYASFKQAVGEYDCPCGSRFEFGTYDSVEDYAALNRWLGRHYGACNRVSELTALCKTQSDEIRSLNLMLDRTLDQIRRKKAGW